MGCHRRVVDPSEARAHDKSERVLESSAESMLCSSRRPVPSVLSALLVLVAMGLSVDCDQQAPGAAAASASAKPKTPDRLMPGELAEGKADLFGLRLPQKMQLEAKFPTSALASGPVEPSRIVDYVKKRITVRHVELAGPRTVFDKALIKNGDPKQLFRIEVIPGRHSKLVVELLNPPRPPAAKGLSEAERWRQVGLTPDGKQLNPKDLE